MTSDEAGDPLLVEIPRTANGYGAQTAVPFPQGSQSGFSGVAVDPFGDLFVAGIDAGVYELPRTARGWGTVSQLPFNNAPQLTGLTLDSSGDVFISEEASEVVVELPKGPTGYGAQSTVPFRGLGQPQDVAVDASGDVFVADLVRGDLIELPMAPATADCSTTLPSGTVVGMADTSDGQGYWIASSTGRVAVCGETRPLWKRRLRHRGYCRCPERKRILARHGDGTGHSLRLCHLLW